MPLRYHAIKRSLIKQGKSESDAKRIAAIRFNKTRKRGEKPVGPHRHK